MANSERDAPHEELFNLHGSYSVDGGSRLLIPRSIANTEEHRMTQTLVHRETGERVGERLRQRLLQMIADFFFRVPPRFVPEKHKPSLDLHFDVT